MTIVEILDGLARLGTLRLEREKAEAKRLAEDGTQPDAKVCEADASGRAVAALVSSQKSDARKV